MWIEKYQYFLCTDNKMRLGWGDKTQISLLICNTLISMCLKMFVGWNKYTPTINYCISSQQAHGFREENTVSVYSFCNFLWSPVK